LNDLVNKVLEEIILLNFCPIKNTYFVKYLFKILMALLKKSETDNYSRIFIVDINFPNIERESSNCNFEQ